MSEKKIAYTEKDVLEFENKYKQKAFRKDEKPNSKFIKYLLNKNSNSIKKTVVVLQNTRDINDNTKVDNISYEVELSKEAFDMEISKLIKEANKINQSDESKKEIYSKIKELMVSQALEKDDYVNSYDLQALDISAQDNLLDTSRNYVGFVYFFWSAETMNFKIVGLHSINPLFEFWNVKQTFYLQKATMITNDKPIFFCFDKIPYSIHFDIKDDMLKLTDHFVQEGITSDLFYFMEKNKLFIRVYGYNKIPMRVWLMLVLIIGFALMLEYIILFNCFFIVSKG